MTIAAVRITPLRLPLKQPYVWSQGAEDAFTVNLIELTAEDGTKGFGETPAAPDAEAQKLVLEKLTRGFPGASVFDIPRLLAQAYRAHFAAFGANMNRYFNQLSNGLEMAALDLQGKLVGRPVWDLLGGAVRDHVGYFHFLQGETVEALAADGQAAAKEGHPIIYLKVGVDDERDLAAVRAVREAIGDSRLRLDANEAWSPAKALRMIALMRPYKVEYIEQPTPSASQAALAQVAQRSPVAIGADQSVFTLQEVHTACSSHRADMIAIGPREIGGLRAMIKAAAIAEGAGLEICVHSSMTTGIATTAEHHAARAIPNLDDGTQIMWQLLREDIVSAPDLAPVKGSLSLPAAPGFGFELNWEVIETAAARHSAFCRKQGG